MIPPLVLSCEHATCAVPEAFRELFADDPDAVSSPHGWDPGALNLAQHISQGFRTPLLHGEITRLLVDLDRPSDHPEQFSEFALRLAEARREGLLKRQHHPYWHALHNRVADALTRHPAVLHLSFHTFPRTRGGMRESTDIGLLFDPARAPEARLADQWLRAIRAAQPSLTANANQPRSAEAASLGGLLRAAFPADACLSLTVEVCQSFFLDGSPLRWDATRKLISSTLGSLFAQDA